MTKRKGITFVAGDAKKQKETLLISSDSLHIIYEISNDQLLTPLVVFIYIDDKLYCDVDIASLSFGCSATRNNLFKADRYQKVETYRFIIIYLTCNEKRKCF